MSKPDLALLLEVGFIAHEEVGYSRVFDFEFSQLRLDAELLVENLIGEIHISRTANGLLTQAHFEAAVNAICGRCLEAISQPLACKFSELFTLPNKADTNTEMVLPHDGKIDFAPILRDYMLIEVPISSVCRPDCKGLCPTCGVNRNLGDCGHAESYIDPRLSVLKSLLENDN
ncbi:MAG: DUF177 domain-containing protein [Chloroflexi bacterium]|jgi:uncharacterized protein|nr:DUF177 domain-containing protein [Chloroflexota bacterium]